MPYQEPQTPDPTYLVKVSVEEITPEYRTGTGSSLNIVPAKKEEVVAVTVRSTFVVGAIDMAIKQLTTAKEDLP